jgi:hypothetical protein
VHLLKWVRGPSSAIGTISPGPKAVSMKFIEKQYQQGSTPERRSAAKGP